MTVISLGAGVQSTTLLLLSCEGKLLPKADFAVFADTSWEPKAVYEHLGRLTLYAASKGVDILRVSAGNLRDDALSSTRSASMPLYTKDESDKVSMLRRQCTREYKVAPILRLLREKGATKDNPAELWIGISLDESHRMKDSFVQYTSHSWPLIYLRWDRARCREYLAAQGWAHVPKSSCIGCPFHDDHYWERMKADDPEEFADAVAFDEAIRNLPRLRDETYLHRSARPLATAVFDSTQQLDLFGNECEGMCGV